MPNSTAAAVGALTADLVKPENLSCPYAMWRRLRTEHPVARIALPGPEAGVFFISRKEDLEFAGKHPEIFSSEVTPEVWRWGGDLGPELSPIIADGGYDLVHTIVSSDPPRATFYRSIALEALSPKTVRSRQGALQELIDETLDALPEDDVVDFRNAFAVPLPLRAIMNVYGLPREHEQFVYDFSCALLSLVDPITPLEKAKEDVRLIVRAQKMLAPLIEGYREKPQDNFLSHVANARKENGDLLSMAEALSFSFIALVGGNETTRNALATTAYLLARDRDLWERLRADPDAIPAFVEEAVRLASPAAITARQAAQDTELGGVAIPKGAAVFLLWGSGSRDETAFEAPDEVRLDRENARRHTSFGAGVHHCAGAHLARAEIDMSVRSWLDRFEKMELAVPEDDVKFDPVLAIRALSSLPLKLTRR